MGLGGHVYLNLRRMLAPHCPALQEVQNQACEIAWRGTKLERVNFELARQKCWKFDAQTKAITAQKSTLFQDTLAEDNDGLRVQRTEIVPRACCAQPCRLRRIRWIHCL